MRKTVKIWLVASLACALFLPVSSSAAWAAGDGGTVAFSLPGVDFVFPFPDGYCAPTGRYDAQARITAAADHTNLTDVSYYRCEEMAAGAVSTRWGMLKTPMAMLNSAGTTRAALIDYLKTQINPDDMKKLLADGAKLANEGVHQTLGEGANLTADLKALDADANAAYMGGTVAISADSGQRLVACVYATTIVKDRVFLLYLFQRYNDPRDIVDLLAIVRTSTAKFVAANGG